jgi:very-short-patch-repair endonuclease
MSNKPSIENSSEFTQLRECLRPLITQIAATVTHVALPVICQKIGLANLTPEGTKRERITTSFDALSLPELLHLAQQLLKLHPPSAIKRNEIQDILWTNETYPVIPKKNRREIARILSVEDLYEDTRQFDLLLDKLWVLDTNPWESLSNFTSDGLREAIQQNVYRNPGDWSVESLFDALGALDAHDRRFALFLEGLASSDLRPDEVGQRGFVSLINPLLLTCGVELRESDMKSGYPVFTLVSTSSTAMGRPKNLIFASSAKPDLRFRDALNNDIEIVTNADKVLVYDRPIGANGLSWNDLQLWWSEMNKIGHATDAKSSLYARLLTSLPTNSPPQVNFFKAFYHGFGAAVPNLPVLLPEVWLHWDPRTVNERGRDALLRFRMDFLMLLPNGVRVVIEIDGKHHYASDDGRADINRYAKMVAADRELKLLGYQVFRFGAAELQDDSAQKLVKEFFETLFKRFSVSTSRATEV